MVSFLPNSIDFYLFFAAIFFLHVALPQKVRWCFLLLASYIFYALLDLRYFTLLAVATYADYILALSISKQPQRSIASKQRLIGSIILNLGLLFGFKYLNMFGRSLEDILCFIDIGLTIPHLEVIIPVGISFFTFKKISYVVDVYKGEIEAENHLGHFALYVSFFLEIVAGPIDRAGDLLPAIKKAKTPGWHDIQVGVLFILYGLFMKVVVADRLSIYTDAVFNNVEFHKGPSLLVASYFYSFQIYADFAGYTNIALGCGRLLGYRLHPNFNLPYFSQSISGFWRRWHMSLSYWLRDYLYIPLGGNRVKTIRRYINLMIVFLVCGMWHGSNWNFIIWGGIHGLYIVISRILSPIRKIVVTTIRLPRAVWTTWHIFWTFHLVTFAWIFFRANSCTDAITIITNIPHGWPNLFIDASSMAHGFVGILVLLAVEGFQYHNRLSFDACTSWAVSTRWAVAYSLIILIVIAGVNRDSAFIYYQF